MPRYRWVFDILCPVQADANCECAAMSMDELDHDGKVGKVQVSEIPTQSCDKEKSFTDVRLSSADLSALLAMFGEVFSNCRRNFSPTRLLTHSIKTGGTTPIILELNSLLVYKKKNQVAVVRIQNH